jgi:hypothetical protein
VTSGTLEQEKYVGNIYTKLYLSKNLSYHIQFFNWMNLPLTKRKYTFLIGNMLNFMTFHVLTAKSVNEDGCLLRSAPCSLIERPTDQRFNRTSASETSCQYLPEYTVQHLTRQPSSRTMWFVNSTYITSGAEIWHHCLTHVMEVWQVLVRLYPTGRCFLFH